MEGRSTAYGLSHYCGETPRQICHRSCCGTCGENNFVSSWEVLSADSKSFNEAKEKLKFFESEGVKGCCIINTYADASDETEAGAVARMFRLMYGMDMV